MTLASMTGFARCEGALDDWNWAVEARSVNGRNLELRFRGPAGLDGLERLARDAAQSRFNRGQISLSVQSRRISDARRTRINLETLERYLAFGEGLVANGRAAPASLDGLLALPGVLETVDQDQDPVDRGALESAMMVSIGRSLDELKLSRQTEGVAIAALLFGFLDRIESLARSAETEAALQPGLIKTRFERRLIELLSEAASAERIVQEAAVMAIKADVREEIDRLASHIGAARALIEQGGASGRRLDFLTQEFMREANTLCSKSASSPLTTLGLELKATIDQFREQVQNVE
jgi:uncharacterized protein (TIGR00255 family)